MSFDHRDPDRKVGCVGHFIRANDEAGLRAEVAKCDVVCMNCHAVRTSAQGLTKKQRAKVSQALRSGVMKEVMSRPEVRAKISASKSLSLREQWKDPEFREKMVSAQHSEAAEEKRAASLSKSISQLWDDPDYRARHSDSNRRSWEERKADPKFNSDDARALRRERANKAWETRRKNGLDKVSQDPAAQERRKEAAKKAWETRRKSTAA